MSTKSWRDVLPIHPAAELFPLMAPDALRALGADIKKGKLREPITLWFPDPESNKPELLDGRNRLDAMEAVGLSVVHDKPRGGGIHQLLVAWKGLYSPADPHAYVVSANIHRRHLNVYQRDELITKLLAGRSDEIKPSDRENGRCQPSARRQGAGASGKDRRRGNHYHVDRHQGAQAAGEAQVGAIAARQDAPRRPSRVSRPAGREGWHGKELSRLRPQKICA